MGRYLARYVYKTEVYTGFRIESLVHHLEFEHSAGWWGAKLMCNGQIVGGGQLSKTDWDALPFLLEVDVSCLTCLVNAGYWSS